MARRREAGMSAAAFVATFSNPVSDPAPSKRATYILATYSLEERDGEWIAAGGFSRIRGTNRAEVIRQARAQWGHFNFADEAEAFATIFPPGQVQS